MTDTPRSGLAERRAEVLDAAIALADAEGLAAVTLRAVAQRVGATAMALYGYFPDKDSLLDAMADRVIGEVSPGPSAELAGWRDRLLAAARLARVMAHEHPSVIQYAFTKPAETPHTMRIVEFTYQALLDAGVPHAEIPRLERFVSTFVIGWALSEASGRFTVSQKSRRERRQLLGPDEMPAYDEVAAVRDTHADPDAEFLADLTGILSLIEAAGRFGSGTWPVFGCSDQLPALRSFLFAGYTPERGAARAVDVPPGGSPGPGGVSGHECLNDLGVLPDGPGWPAWDGEGRLHAPAEHVLQHRLGHGQEAVVGELGNPKVQPGVQDLQLRGRVLVMDAFGEGLEGPHQFLQLLVGGGRRGPAGRGHFQHLPHGEQLFQADLTQPGKPVQGAFALVGRGYEHALAVPDEHDSAGLQGAQGLAYGSAADSQQFAKFPLPGQAIARLQPVAVDIALHVAGHSLEQRLI